MKSPTPELFNPLPHLPYDGMSPKMAFSPVKAYSPLKA